MMYVLAARRCLINTLEDELLEQIFGGVTFDERQVVLYSLASAPPSLSPLHPGSPGLSCTSLRRAIICLRQAPKCLRILRGVSHGRNSMLCRLTSLPRICKRWTRILGQQQPCVAWEVVNIDLDKLYKSDRNDIPRTEPPPFDARVVSAWFSR